MVLTERHIQILKHVHAYVGIKRYHGLLPMKDAGIYEAEALEYLHEEGLIEEGVILTTCGSNPKGYRLSKHALEELEKLGIDFRNEDWEALRGHNWVAADELDADHIDALLDIYHFSKIKKFNGIAPKEVLSDYDKITFNILYDMGYIFHIKLKGANVKYEKGYVLSDKARRMLKQLEASSAP
ncbi:MAG: hypothetical protein KKB70_05320 [Proteobacteria bacterium]|nr:hypothetical protein [Pseudomonadota bacterium]MBU1610592.1 hypothetical protein [Pseudomonadota bacterium]